MSSKRGRKRNDNLPPNRARDVQRAFRARRAAHLQALEQRVAELEEENNCLRQALNLPAANRPPLGKGPTGKDKPKSTEPSTVSQHASLPLTLPLSSRDSSGSPPSTRMSSHSPPGSMGTSIGSRAPVQSVEDGVWEQTIIMSDSDLPSSSASSTYPLPPMSAPPPISSKPISYNPYPNSLSSSSSLPSSSRSMPSPMFLNSQPNYSHSADRPIGTSYGSPTFTMRSDIRDDSRHHYSYSPSPYQSHDTLHTHHGASAVAPGIAHSQSHPPQREPPVSYPHRRSLTEPQQAYSINSGFPHLPNPIHSNQGIRLPSPPRLPSQDGVAHNQPPRNYGPDGRINSMS
ncbi:proteophosphoglycan ppg4 [Moniliophthora roreri]|nr:proteophosphoglycan ppg4 [Moniliophthora roreri]